MTPLVNPTMAPEDSGGADQWKGEWPMSGRIY